MSNKGNLIVISAPSGTGKTSLANRLLKGVPGIAFSVSHTTRSRRPGESNGVEYFFVSEKEFLRLVERDEFLEHAHVYGSYYGTSRSFVESRLADGVDVLLDVDVQGARKVRRIYPEAVLVFVLPPSWDALRERLTRRGLDDGSVVEKRLSVARSEIKYYEEYDYIIINEDLEGSGLELRSIVLAARCRLKRRRSRAEAIVGTFDSKRRSSNT